MSRRIQRVNALIKQELSQLILKELEFPPRVLVTVTRIETSPELSRANVYISVMPFKYFSEVLSILNKSIYFIQQKLNRRLKMRPIPRIQFMEEKKTAEAGRIEELLEKIKKK